MRTPRKLFCAYLILLAILSARATTFHVDPKSGSSDGDGSAARPWRNIQDVVDNELSRHVDAGDTILLHEGYHGNLAIRGVYNDGFITIAAAPNETAKLRRIHLVSVGKWRFEGLHISPSFASSFEKTMLVLVESGRSGAAREVVVDGCSLYMKDDCSDWSATEWSRLTADAVKLEGVAHVVRNCHIKNIKFGASVSADSCLVEHNLIENYSGDGIRGLGDHCTYQYNTIRNNYRVDGNHDDGFQSYSIGRNGVGTGVVTGVTIRGNMIINYVDPDQPFRGTVQGIGCFDGMFEDWLIEHNVIVVDTWHGITLRGAVNCTIRNNTICDRNSSRPGPPWIRLDHHKNGTPSRDNVVTCNLSTRYDVSSSEADMSDNLTIRDPRDWVVDYDVLNMRIKDDSPARGGASDGGDIGAYLFVGQLPDDVTAVLTGGEKPMDYAVRDGAAPGSQVSRIGSTVELFDLQGRCRFFATPKIKQMAPGTYILRDAGRARMKSPLIQKR